MGLGFFRLVMSLFVIDQHYKWSITYVQPLFVNKLGVDHFGFIGLGHAAVMSFFVLSGYVITWVLNNKYPVTNQGVKAFFVGRFMRIYPLYWVLVGIVIIGFLLAPGPASDYPQLKPERIIGDLTLLPYAFIGFFHFLNKFAYGMIDIPAWTLPYDLLFYLIAPWVVMRKRILAVIIGFELLYLAVLGIWGPADYGSWHQGYLTTGHAAILAFCVGALAYYYREFRIPAWLLLGAVMLYFYITFFPYHLTHYHLNHGLIVLLSAIIVLGFKNRSKFDNLLGELTYSTYLLHMPLFGVLTYYGVAYPALWALLTTYVLSYATVKFFEAPLERKRAEITRHMLADVADRTAHSLKGAPIVIGLLAVLLVVSAVHNVIKLTG